MALLFDDFGIDPAAFVTNEHVYQIAHVLNFNLDLCRLGMTQRRSSLLPFNGPSQSDPVMRTTSTLIFHCSSCILLTCGRLASPKAIVIALSH